jgi:hypothetical protein
MAGRIRYSHDEILSIFSISDTPAMCSDILGILSDECQYPLPGLKLSRNQMIHPPKKLQPQHRRPTT